ERSRFATGCSRFNASADSSVARTSSHFASVVSYVYEVPCFALTFQPLAEQIMKILVADDDPICRKIMAKRLRAFEDCEVVEAADGNEAWTMLKRNHFDGMIVDWQMPGRDGLEIVREIRKAGVNMPLLMVTGESEKERVVEAIKAGVTDYLIKPFDA